MPCNHDHLRCTNGEFFCLDCGARVHAPVPKQEKEEKPVEKKTGGRRKRSEAK